MKAMRFLTLALLIATGTTILWAQGDAEFTEPGWFRPADRELQVELQAWNEANQTESGASDSGGLDGLYRVSAPEIAEAITPEIQSLARGLENNPTNIFNFVRDHIRYVHYFGSKKGAQLTLLERSGNDFDQCALLVALLHAANCTAIYRFGTAFMPYELTSGVDYHRDFKHWLGLSKPNTNWTEAIQFASNLNNYRGFPFTGAISDYPNILVIHRVWVLLSWSNAVYALDPAFKVYEPTTGINLATAIGLDTNQIMTAAGGTSNADYVVTLDEASLRNKLRDYTTNFLQYIRGTNPNASVEQILGSQYVYEGQYFGAALPVTPLLWNTNSPTVDWNYIPTNLMTTLQVSIDNTNQFLWMPELQGKRLSLTFTTNGLGELRLDDEVLLQKQTSGGGTVNVALKVDHPHGLWNFTNNTLINTNWDDHAVTNTYQRTNASYAIVYAFEPDAEWLRQRQDRLDRYRQQGLADTSREIATETLNIMGLNWMLQTERIPRLLAAQQEMLLQHHHRLGRMAQEFGQGYYIDIYQQLSGSYPASGTSTNDFARNDRIFDLESYFASAAEHGLIEQLQSSNLFAASTIKMLQIGNTNGQRTYLAKSSNWSTVQTNLSYYNLNFLKTNYIDKGYSLLLPANGSNLLAGAGSWAGYGVVARGVITNIVGTSTNIYKDMVMLIKGGYHGGYVSDPAVVVDTPFVYQSSYVQPTYFAAAPPLIGSPFGADPVSMADGAFNLSVGDLSLGQAEPRGISLTRHYTSSRRFHNLAGMASGWVHNYYIRAADASAPLASLGDTTPAQMAPLIVATKTAFELYKTTGNPKTWAVTALIAKWGADQMINNAVSLSLGKDTVQFIKQPDGTFTPPAGSTMTLLKTNGVYWLQQRHGNTFKFNSTGFLTNITDQYNQTLNLTYGTGAASNWVAQITDWTNRIVTLTYSGTPSRLTSVADNSSPSRSVSYGYTTTAGQLDLTSVTDAEGKTSTFLYDTNHQIIVASNALSQVVVSNAYDGFGRVIEQYSKGDTNQTWQLFWSGFLNTEKDPAGGRKQYYYDDKHRLATTIDAMGHYNYTIYDGQDHVFETISHLNATTYFYYDGRHNLIATFDPLLQEDDFYYDDQDQLYHVWDKRGFHSYFGYNAQHSLTGSTNGAGDWVTSIYNGNGTLASRTDPGGTTSYGYDAYGQPNLTTFPGSLGSEGWLNNSRGDILSHTNARGFVTSFQYNQRRELTNTIAPTNITTSVVYDAVGNVQSTKDARTNTTTYYWSPTRKRMGVAMPGTPQGVPVSTNFYDNHDWLVRTINPQQSTINFTNDAAERLIAVTDPLNRATRFGYDEDNRKTSTTNAANEVTRQSWSVRSELLQVTTPALTTINRRYDAAGNQITLTNRNGKKWQFQFDSANRLTNNVTPLNRQTKQVWNNRGLLQTVIEPSTDTANFYYDARARLTNRTDAVGTTLYGYDANNNLTSVTNVGQASRLSQGFDAYDRMTSHTNAAGYVIQYRYDANGNLTNLVYPGNRTVTYAYDSLNRLTNVTDWANRKTTNTYDLASRVKSITRPNGTVREINYDAAGQTTNIVERLANNAPIAFFKLNWNDAGRIAWEFAAPLPHAYTNASRIMYADADNRMTNFNGQVVSYDLDGNMTNGPLTSDALAGYTYDARNRLLNVGGDDYGYDPAGNRTSVSNASGVATFVVNPNAPLSQVLMRVKGGTTNYYIYGVGLLYEIAETATSTNTLTYHYDYRGSTVALTDGNGVPKDRMEYSDYGLITYRAGTNDTPFLFNGRYGVQSDSNGLLYMRARYYNPYICRFINADPSGFSGGLNFYAYADGNPISLIDPFGLGAQESEGWGGATATWINRNVVNPLNSVSTTSTTANFASYMAGSIIGGLGDLLRLGQGSANATYNAQDGWDVAIGITQDVGRAAGITTIVGGGLEATFNRVGTRAPVIDNTPASTPVGRLGDPLTVQPGANTPTTINGVNYTGHALDSMQARGITPSVVQDTISRGARTSGYDGATIYTTEQARVIVNPNGSIKTVYPHSP